MNIYKITEDSISLQCPYCNEQYAQHLKKGLASSKSFQDLYQLETDNGESRPVTAYYKHYIYSCSNCERDSYLLLRDDKEVFNKELLDTEDVLSGSSNLTPSKVGEINRKLIHRYPIPTPSIHTSVPEDVTKATIEAEKTLSMGAITPQP